MADKFRQAKVPRHVRIYHRQMQSIAWKHLTGGASKVLLALATLEKGDNNGQFFMSTRTGAEWTGLSKNAVHRALQELQDKGFIYCAERGGFSRKTPHAASWGLTWAAGPKGSEHRAPSHAYEKWRPAEKRGPRKSDTAVPETKTVGNSASARRPRNVDSEIGEMPEFRQSATVSKSGTHNSNQAPVHLARPQAPGDSASLAWWNPDLSGPIGALAKAKVLSALLEAAAADHRIAA
ncbi:MAG: helix-turn-helix domain-containing protein [Proteobacteria bacterium]|nr:helix-turn-helix domain-containing protein [Pseudomonadota bacterium]